MSEFIDLAAVYPDNASGIVRQLIHWCSLYPGLDLELEKILDIKIRELKIQNQQIADKILVMEKACEKRKLWNDKLELIIEIQTINKNPVFDLLCQVEENEAVLKTMQEEIDELEFLINQSITQIEVING